jgi:hypothetical protein
VSRSERGARTIRKYGEPQIWALVEPDQPEAEVWFRIAGTGHPITDDIKRYVGTFQIDRGSLVFHVFEVAP